MKYPGQSADVFATVVADTQVFVSMEYRGPACEDALQLRSSLTNSDERLTRCTFKSLPVPDQPENAGAFVGTVPSAAFQMFVKLASEATPLTMPAGNAGPMLERKITRGEFGKFVAPVVVWV